MAFLSIKSELRRDYLFFKKFLIFYLVISHALISCKIEIFPDHFSKEDPNFKRSQVKRVTTQEFYYDLGYFTEKTEKYRSPKYGINYRPVKCQKMADDGAELTYNPDDPDSFFGPNRGFENIGSTLEKNNKFDDTKLFRNTIKGNNFYCPSPIRAFHNTDRFEINLTLPIIADPSPAELEMFLFSGDGQLNASIDKTNIPANSVNMIKYLIIPNSKENYTTEMNFKKNRDDPGTTISIYGDPDLYIQFFLHSGTSITLSNYRVIVNDSNYKYGLKYTSEMVRSKNGLRNNCTKDDDCFIGFMCSYFECKPCHTSCAECTQDDSNPGGMNYCSECNMLSNYLYPQESYCDIGYVDVSLFKNIDVRVKPDQQDFNDRETLGFWIFFSNTFFSRLNRIEPFDDEDNNDIIHHVVLKDRLVISMIQKVDKVKVYCHVYENIFSKNTSDIVYWRYKDNIKDLNGVTRGFYPHDYYYLQSTVPSTEQEDSLTLTGSSGDKTIDGHWVHISCAESFDHGLYYLKTVINGKMEYEEQHLTGEPFLRTFDEQRNLERLDVVNDKYFKPIINDDDVLHLQFKNFNYSLTKIYLRHLTLFKEYIPVKMQYMYFDYTGVSDFFELLYYIPFTKLKYGNEYSIKGYSYGNVEENIILELNTTKVETGEIIVDLSPPLNFKHLNFPGMNFRYKEIDLVGDELEPLEKSEDYKYVYDDNEPLCCKLYLNHDINECDDTCVNFRRLPFEGINENSGYCDYTCSDSMSCLVDHLNGDDLDYDKQENGFCTSLSKAYNLFFRCEDDQIDYYLQYSGFYNSGKLEKKFPKMHTYVIDFWYYDDYLLKQLEEKFFGDGTYDKHYVFHSNVVDLFFKIETEDEPTLYPPNSNKKISSHYTSHDLSFTIKGIATRNLAFTFQEWTRVYISAYYNRTEETTQFTICLNYFDRDARPDERGSCEGTTIHQPSLAIFEEIFFCHGTCKDWNLETIHWATGYYKNLRVWDGNNVSPNILKQYDYYYPDYVYRVSSLKYFFPLKNKYISNNKIIDPKNKETFTATKSKYNLKKYNFSSKFDLIATQRKEGYCYQIHYEQMPKVHGREINTVELIPCATGCERCWYTDEYQDRCYKCKKGYYLDILWHCQKIGQLFFKSPNLLGKNLDAVVNKITLIENKPAVTVTFWFKVFGFSGDDHITMFTIGDHLQVVFSSSDTDPIRPYGLSIVNDNRLVSNVFNYRKEIGAWSFFSLAYHREMSDFGTNYFPAMMQFELELTNYEVNITNVKKDMSLDSFSIKKEYWGLFTNLKFYDRYIIDTYGYEMKLHVDRYNTPFYLPEPVASFFMYSFSKKKCFDTSYLIGANVNDFDCVPAEGPSHNYDEIFNCMYRPEYFQTNKGCNNECFRQPNGNNVCTCMSKNYNSQMIFRNGDKNICVGMDFINFANSGEIVIQNVPTARLTRRYTMQFWMYAYNYIEGRFGGIEFYWDGHSKIIVEKGSQSFGNNIYEFHCVPYLNEDGSIPRKLTTTILINKWNFLSCAVDFVEINYYINVNTLTHELYLKRANLIQTTATELLLNQETTTLTIKDTTKFRDWGLLFFMNIRLWNWCYFNAEFLSRLDIRTRTKFPYLIEQWNPTHPQITTKDKYYESFIVKGYQTSFEVKFNQLYGINVLDEYFYKKVILCSEDGQYYDVAQEKCLQFVDLSKMNDFQYNNIPISFSGSYSMSVWIFLEDAAVLSQGLHITWTKHLQITIIRTTRLEAYCFPQGYYSDSVPNDNIQYKFSSALNVGQVYLVEEQTSESAVWINVICAMSHYNQMFYVNGMDEKTLIERTLNNEILYKDTEGNTINSYRPMRYYFGSDQSNYLTDSTLFVSSITNTKRIYFRALTLFRDYIPYWYNKILRNMNLRNMERGRVPSIVFFCNFVDYNLNSSKLEYLTQYNRQSNNDYLISYSQIYLVKNQEYTSATFELCTNFRFMPLCEFSTKTKMKYDPDRNYCVFISDCDLTELNAYYCMEERTPISCLPNYYITADSEDQIYCSGNCIREQIRHPGTNQTQGICNSYCDKGTKQCPGTSSSFLNDYQINYECNENNYRIGYHCLGRQYSTKSALFFSKCYNSPNFANTIDVETQYKYRFGYVLEFWMKLDVALNQCKDGYSTSGEKEYYFKSNVHSIYFNINENKFFYICHAKNNEEHEIAGVQTYEWNKFYLRTKLDILTVDLFLNFEVANPKFTVSGFTSIAKSKLSLSQISFCSRSINGITGQGCSGINWGSAYYRNIRVWDDRTATIKMIQDFNNELFEEFPNSLILYYPLTIQFMDNNVIKEIISGIDSFKVSHKQTSQLQSTDENIFYNYELNHDWGDTNPGYFISAIGETEEDMGVVTPTACHPACKRCYSSTAANCYVCNEGYVLNGMECIRINGYFLKIPAKTLNTIIPFKIEKDSAKVKELPAWTFCIYMKFEGIVAQGSSQPIIIQFKSDTFMAYDVETTNLVFIVGSLEAFRDTNFHDYFGIWIPICVANYMSGAILNEVYPNMITLNVNKEDIPLNEDYKIPDEGVKIDQISFHYQVIAFFADFRIYDRFIQGNFGTVVSSSTAAEHLLIYYSLNGNGACIQADYLTTSDKIQVDCVPDYNIYVDDSRKCVDNTYYFDTQFESENIPCASCDETCVTKCFRGNKQECTCDMENGLYWLRKHETSFKTYCEYLPYIDFSAIQDVEMYVPSSATYESTLELWFFAYSYNFETFNFKKMTINWNLHNKIEVYMKGNDLTAQCYALSDNSREGFYTESIEQKITKYRWNKLRCGSEFISRRHKYFFNQQENDLVIKEYPDRVGKITTLKISNDENSYDSYGFVFLRELKLWQQYNYIYIDSSYINLESYGLYSKENRKSFGIFPGLIAYYKNEFKISDYEAELNPPHRYTIENLLGGESNVEVHLVNKWSTMRRPNFIGYNIVDPTNDGSYKDVTLCEEGEVYNESSDTCSKPLTTHCEIPADIGDTCLTCPEETIYINTKDGSCTNNCPVETYARDDINECRDCHITCYTCTGPFYNNCTSCTGPLCLVSELHICIDACEDYNLTMDPNDHNKCIEFVADAQLINYDEGIPIDIENLENLWASITYNSISSKTRIRWEFDANATRIINNDMDMEFPFDSPFDGDITSLDTSVDKRFFELAKKYVVNLIIIADNGNGLPGKSISITVPFVLTMNSYPFNGNFRISPTIGLFNTTTFLFVCENYDDDTTKNLVYSFYYKEKGTKGSFKVLRGWSSVDETTSNFTVEYSALPSSNITIQCLIRDNYGATTTVSQDIVIATSLDDGIYDLKDGLLNYKLPAIRTDIIYYHRSQYLMSLGIDKYKFQQPNLYKTKYKASADRLMIVKADPQCTLDYCNNNGYCDLMDEFINCHCDTGFIGRNCHIDKNGYETLKNYYNELFNKLIGDLSENITYLEFKTFHNLYFGACQFILDPGFFKINLDTFLTLAMSNYKHSILNNTAEYFDLIEYYYSYELTLMEQERGKIKYLTGLKVRNITLSAESMADYKASFDYIHEELIKLMKYIANEYVPKKDSFFYESKNFYLALTPVEPGFDEAAFFEERKNNYRSQAEFMNCVNYLEIERLRNPNYYLYLFFIEYYYAPFAYNNTLLKNNTGPVIELRLFDTVTGKFLTISECQGSNRIKLIIPYSGYYYLDDFNSQKNLYDPNVYKSPDDKIFEDPIYIMDNGNVTGITVEELKKIWYRRMNITPKYYDDLLGDYTDAGLTYMNFTNDTNYIIFSSSHLTRFTAFFVPNNATFKTNNRFFYLKRPRILKFIPNYFKSWGVFLFIALLLLYLIILSILSIYDSKYRNKEALLEYIKDEVIQFSLHYKKEEEKDNYIPNIFRKKYDFRYFEENRGANTKLATTTYQTNEDLKTSTGFWQTDKKRDNNVNSEGEKLSDMDMDDIMSINDQKPKLRSNFFYQGSVKQKKLTLEDKLKKKTNNNNNFFYKTKNNAEEIKKRKRRQIQSGININNDNRQGVYEKEDEVRHQELEEFASIDLFFSEFLLTNIFSRSILVNSYVIVSIFSPRWKKQSLLLTEMCAMIILISVFLTNDETIRTGNEIIQIVIVSVICMICVDFFMYIFAFFFFSFPLKSHRKLFNLVIHDHQLEILKEWDKIERRMQKFEIIGMILSAAIWIFAFYISFGFTVVWSYQREAFLISFAFTFLFNFVIGELLMEIFIAFLYLGREHSSFFRFCAEGLNRLRNIRCLSP